jgi:hypothetical protein
MLIDIAGYERNPSIVFSVISDDMKFTKRDDIDDLKKKLRALKTEMKAEVQKEEAKDVSTLVFSFLLLFFFIVIKKSLKATFVLNVQ